MSALSPMMPTGNSQRQAKSQLPKSSKLNHQYQLRSDATIQEELSQRILPLKMVLILDRNFKSSKCLRVVFGSVKSISGLQHFVSFAEE